MMKQPVAFSAASDWAPPRIVTHGSEAWLLQLAGFQMFCAIYLQKLAVPGSGSAVSLPMLLIMASLPLASLLGIVAISRRRLALYLVFCAAALLSQALQREASLASMAMLLALYAQFVFQAPMSADLHRRYLATYQALMVPPALMVLIQLASQFLLGFGTTPSIEPFIPQPLLLAGFYYDATLFYGTDFVRPNGFFFLEPSFVSAFLACSLLIELCHLRRYPLAAVYGLALVGSLGATGLLMAMVAFPIVLAYQPRRVRLALLAALAAGLCVLLWWKGQAILFRLEGFTYQRSSEYGRVVKPVVQLLGLMGDQRTFLFGSGAGSVDDQNSHPWPVVKILTEYGIFTTIAFFALLLRSVTWVFPVLVLPLLVIFNFTGNYALNPIAIILLLFFCTLPGREDAPRRRRTARAA